MKTNPTSLEILEDRIAPAGLITAVYNGATGELTLTGDAAANQANVFQTGTNTYRVEGIGTDINAGGVTFLDIGKLTKLTINGGDSSDQFDLLNLRTLKSLTINGGNGDDTIDALNLTVSGATELHGNAGQDSFFFDGVSTLLKGTLTVDSAAAATDLVTVNFNAQETVVGGVVTFTGGGDGDTFATLGDGPATFSKGIIFNAGAGGANLDLNNDDTLSVGKLATGESILFTGGDGEDDLTVAGINSTLAGGIRFTGGLDDDDLNLDGSKGTLKLGKLTTGQSILFDGGADNDTISIASFSTNLSGAIEFLAGDGTNSITLDAPGGTTKVGKLSTGESIRYAGGTGGDTITTNSTNLNFAGGVSLNGGAGTNLIDLNGLGGKTAIGKIGTGQSLLLIGGAAGDTISADVGILTLAGGIELNGGDGTNRIDLDAASGKASIGKMAAGQSFLLTGGTGSDTIDTDVADLTLKGGIELNGGDGTNTIDLAATSGKAVIGKTATGQSILFNSGSDDDTINTTVANLTLKGGIEFTAGNGTNLINLNSPGGTVQIGVLATGQSILLNGGTGSDDITSDIARVTLTGGIEHNGGGGDNDLEFDDNGFVKIGKFGAGISVNFTSLAASNADNELDFGGFVTLAGSINVVGGTGTDDIDFDGKVSVGKDAAGVSVSMIGNDGDDDIDFTDNITLAGSLIHDGGNDDDLVDLDGVDTLTIKGPVQFTGGAGADVFDLNVFSLVLGSTLTVTGGDDADEFHLIADGSVAGDVNVDLGLAAAGVQRLEFIAKTGLPSGLSLKKALTVNATAAATIDTLTITNVAVAKLIDIKLGDGVSTVNIDNLNAGDEFELDTRSGADVVNIERQNFFGLSVIKKLATILTGDGDDQLAIGNPLPPPNPAATPDSTRVNFIGGLITDGGAGALDNRNDFGAQNDFGVPLTPPVNFELITLV